MTDPKTCRAAQNRLLVDGTHAAAAAHAAECARCERYLDRLRGLDAELRDLPAAPYSESNRLAFLDALTAAGPMITVVPTLPHRPGLFDRLPLRKLAFSRPAAGLAAGVLAVVGLWAARPAKTPRPPEPETPRYELLKAVVTIDTDLAKLTAPEDRIPKLADMADALHAESRQVYKAAVGKDEMRSLAASYEKVVKDGIVKQAGRFPAVAVPTDRHTRKTVLTATADRLLAAAAEAETLAAAPATPAAAKESFIDIARTARAGRADLLKLLEGV